MLTVGVDLAAEPEGTVIACLEWSPGRATLRGLVLGAKGQQILKVIKGDKAGSWSTV